MIAILAFAAVSVVSAHGRTDCVEAPGLKSALGQVIEAVNDGTPARLDALLNGIEPAARRDQMRSSLGIWHWRSDRLAVQSFCATTPSQGAALLTNAMTGEVDSLWISIDTATHNLRQLRVPFGGRPQIKPSDTVSERSRANALKAMVEREAAAGRFSGEIIFAHEGRVLLHEALGIVNRETGRKARDGEQFSIASVGKMLTGTAIMHLVEQGRMQLDDSLGMFLSANDRPKAAGGVPIKYMLAHTSGIVRDHDTLSFKPGARFDYENYNYYLLGKVIEKVTGKPFDRYFEEAIYKPAHMSLTERLVRSEPDPALAPAYDVQYDGTGLHFNVNPQAQTIPATGAGGMFSTADDLFAFVEALRTGKLVSKATLELMRSPRTELGAKDYGFGIDRYRGGTVWGHSGYVPGANTDVELYGDSGYVLVVIGNMPANEPIRRLAAALVGNPAFAA